jgi:transposase, IS6 family
MVLAPSVAGLFKWRQFEPEVILLAVGWYLRFSVLPRRRGTLGRTRDFGRSRHALAVGAALYAGVGAAPAKRAQGNKRSWRVDETYVRVKGKWVYLYRAVDSEGATIDFLLSANGVGGDHPPFGASPSLSHQVIRESKGVRGWLRG